MVKRILIALVCFAATGIYAQNGSVSPYSYFGIGDLRAVGTVENQMMGGVSMYGDSIHINLRNPAAYSQLALTTYTAGISRRELRLKTFEEQQRTSITTLDYLALGFPIAKKMGMGLGIMPFSSIGYNLTSQSVDQNGSTVTNAFTGEGGLNRAYLSLGYEAFKDFRLGATVNFNFGSLENRRVQSVEDVQFGTLDDRESKVNGFDFNFSANYTPKIKEKYTLYTSVLVNTQANLVSENTQAIGSFSSVTGVNIEVIDVNLAAQNLKNTEIKIPTTTTLGLGFGEDKKWFMGAEYSFQKLSAIQNDFLEVENLVYNDASSIAFGGYFIPEYNSFDSFFKRVTYRAGLRLDNTGMMVNNKEINNFGITFGLGLPLGGSFSNVNLGFELGRRGTTDASLVEESYLKINLGLSLNDRWFVKRQIN
ncbi:hypothetical protein [Costertonia aggregata]|uniref:Outer membrane protein transport protein n=1 Tax=Costertonia aggregata TaxID=343403 RepID=A0A7H9AQW2_9FLAO|nr:hypothetical protein [Costertonia aggregata]QLG45789.1 hypothetical protein HYG79_10660 [Costertonia aggregata]